MSNKDISRYLTKENGSTFSNDTELLNLATNSKIKNKNSGIAFKKVDGAVFDKLPIEVETTAVLYTAQTLTTSQKQQARENIGVDELDGVPLGTIVMWSGKANTIPDGWQICDGNNGTPNLVGRFVIGRSSAYPLNTYGGSTDHFHYFGYHTGDNSGVFYINGDPHQGDPYRTNCPKTMKAPKKAAILNSLSYNDTSPDYVDSEIKPKSAKWNGDGGGGIASQSFQSGNLITTLGYGVTADDTLKDCLPPYWSLYYIMKVRGTGSTSNGGTAASASQVELLSDLIDQLKARITTLENSSSSGGSGSGSGFTFGTEFAATIRSTVMLSEAIPAGTILDPSLYYCSDGTTTGASAVRSQWKLYRGTLSLSDQLGSGSLITNGSYIVTQASTVTSSGSQEYGISYYNHNLKLRKITGVSI